jgi:hypothetical protein
MKKMLKRADGSYSQRGLWDNIRANKGSGKEPTKEMLKQEKKIKSKKQTGGKKSNWLEESKELTFGGLKYQTAGFDKQEAMAKELGMVKDAATGKWVNPPKTTKPAAEPTSYLESARKMFSSSPSTKLRTEEGGIRRKLGGKKRMGGKKC